MTRRGNRYATTAIRTTFLLLLLSAGRTGLAQLNSNTPAITLNAALAESISVSATPSTVTFNLVPGGIAMGSSPIAITTTWILASSRAAVTLIGSFGSPTTALAGSSIPEGDIPTSAVFGLMSTGLPTVFTAFTVNTPLGVVSAGLPLFTQILTSASRNSSRTDNLTLEINLVAIPQLPSGTFTGSLLLQAQAL